MYWLGFILGSLIFIASIAGVLCYELVWRRSRNRYHEYWKVASVVIFWLGGIVGLILILLFGIRMLTLHYDRVGCESWGQRTGLQVKFVKLPAWSTDCLVHVKSGRWIPQSQIGNFDQ